MAQTSDTGSSKDLLIVGPGVLGSYLGKRWLERFPEATVLGQTNTTDNHARLEKLGLKARTAKQAEESEERFPNVVFAAPASGSEDYVADIKKALAIWDGSGAFVFTSSAGTYAANDGSSVDEESPLVPLGTNERNDRQIQGEQVVLERGAHTFFLKMGKVDRWEGYTVNLIHYQDAASMCIAVLAGDGQDAPHRGRLFVGTDGSPITFKDMMDATLASGAFQGQVEFTAAEGASKGKRVNNDKSRAALDWAPQFASFADFMATTGAKDFYTESGLF